MDQWLANVYGTGNQEVDLEKVAQMAILEKLANDEGYDLSQLSEDEAVELAKSFGGTDGHKFVNGVIDKTAADLRAVEVEAARAARR